MTRNEHPIPVRMASLPIVGGLPVPWITPRDERGYYLFGHVLRERVRFCLQNRHCGVCGQKLDSLMVALVRTIDLDSFCTMEPLLHPECAAFTIRACPMVSGQQDHYRRSAVRLPTNMEHARDVDARLSKPAEPWYAAYLRRYEVIQDPRIEQLVASFQNSPPVRVRPIGTAPPWQPNRAPVTPQDIHNMIRALDTLFPTPPGEGPA